MLGYGYSVLLIISVWFISLGMQVSGILAIGCALVGEKIEYLALLNFIDGLGLVTLIGDDTRSLHPFAKLKVSYLPLRTNLVICLCFI